MLPQINWGGKKSRLNHHQAQKLTHQVPYLTISVIYSINSSHLTYQDRGICLKNSLNAWFCYNALHQEDRSDVDIKFLVLLLMPSGRIVIWSFFFLYIPRTQRRGKTESDGSRGMGGKSDINLLCPLTLQRLAVNQSKPSLFQKALFDHAG